MGKRDYYDPMTMDVKSIPELFDECRAVVFSKLPGTNKFVAATWAALVEANQMYQFAHGVITKDGSDEVSERFVTTHYGQHYATAMIIRKIADALGVSNFKPREAPDGAGTVQGADGGSSPAHEAEAGQPAEECAG